MDYFLAIIKGTGVRDYFRLIKATDRDEALEKIEAEFTRWDSNWRKTQTIIITDTIE